MTDAEQKAARQRCEAASARPWTFVNSDSDGPNVITASGANITCWMQGYGSCIDEAVDAEFIAHARTDLPAALDEIDCLRELLRSLEWAGRKCYGAEGNISCCPCCKADSIPQRHQPDCRLVAAIGKGGSS